jgi:hypothetical protein
MSYIPIFEKTGTTITTNNNVSLLNNLIISGNTYSKNIDLTINEGDVYNKPSGCTSFIVPSSMNGMKLKEVKYKYFEYKSIYDLDVIREYGLLTYDSFYYDFPTNVYENIKYKNTGFGWSNTWATAVGVYSNFLQNTTAVTFDNILSDNRVSLWGGQAVNPNRRLNENTYLASRGYSFYDGTNWYVGRPGTTIWFSSIIRKINNSTSDTRIQITQNATSTSSNAHRFSFGIYSNVPQFRINTATEASANNSTYSSTLGVSSGVTILGIVKAEFGYTGTTFSFGFYSGLSIANRYFIPEQIIYTANTNMFFRTIGIYPLPLSGALFSDFRMGETYESVCMTTFGSDIGLFRNRGGIVVSMLNNNLSIPFGTLTGTTIDMNVTNNIVQTGDIIRLIDIYPNPLTKGSIATLTFEY